MINRIKKITLIILIVFAFSAGSAAYADTARTYGITTYDVTVEILPDGSAAIEEWITYDFEGSFNGALRDVDFSGTSGISGQQVFVFESESESESGSDQPVECSQNGGLNGSQNNGLNSSGQPFTYDLSLEGQIAKFKVYSPSDYEKKTFIYKYILGDAATKYSDTAEFNRKIIDRNWDVNIENVHIRVTIPEGASKDEIKVFAHGPLTGESTITDARTVDFKVPVLPARTFVETRVLFPAQLLPQSTNTIDKEALPGIMDSEGKLAEEANKQREEAANMLKKQQEARDRAAAMGTIIAILLIFGWLPAIIYIYLKYDHELKHGFEAKYYRELPGTYSPAEMSVLMTFGNVAPRDIMATLMDLVRRRHLILTTQKTYKKGLFGGKEVIEYIISRNGQPDQTGQPDQPGLTDQPPADEMKSHELYLTAWFLGRIGNGQSVSLEEIKDYARYSRSNALLFKSNYDAWVRSVRNDAKRLGFFDPASKKGKVSGSLLGTAWFIGGLLLVTLMYTAIAAVAIIQGIILLIFSIRINRRSKYGNEQHAMWHAFKRFLADFSNLERAGIPSIIIWEHYLVYAISLGVAHEVIRQLPLVFRDEDLNQTGLTFLYGGMYGHFAGLNQMMDNTVRSVESAVITATQIASSSKSSGTGGGGGFSGGSSGGGGGGGGGGAF